MTWKMDDEFFTNLEYDFGHHWVGHVEGVMARIPDPLFAALKERIPADFEAVRVHAIRKDDIAHGLVHESLVEEPRAA